MGAELHALHLFEANCEPRLGSSEGGAGVEPLASGEGGRGCEEHRQRGRNGSGADVYLQHRSECRTARPRVEGIRTRTTGAGRIEACGVPSGLRRAELLQRGSPAHRGTDYVQHLGGRKLPGYRGDQLYDRGVTERSFMPRWLFWLAVQHFFAYV